MGSCQPFVDDEPFDKRVKTLADNELLEIWEETQQLEDAAHPDADRPCHGPRIRAPHRQRAAAAQQQGFAARPLALPDRWAGGPVGFSCSQTQSVTASAPSGAQREAIPLPALPQTRFLRPVPSRGRPSFFPVFSHHAARTFLFGATSIGKPQLSRPRNGRSRKRPLPFRGDPLFARPQIPMPDRDTCKKSP